MKQVAVLLVLFVSLVAAPFVGAEEDFCEAIGSQAEAGNFAKALKELEWYRKDLEQKHIEKIKSMLEDKAGECEGGDVTVEGAMGMMNIQRTYRCSGGDVDFSLTGGTGSAQSGLGGMAALGRLGAMMGAGNQNQVRVGDLTGNIEDQSGGRGKLTIFMQSGMICSLEGPKDLLANVAGGAGLSPLDDYLMGR